MVDERLCWALPYQAASSMASLISKASKNMLNLSSALKKGYEEEEEEEEESGVNDNETLISGSTAKDVEN